MEQFDIISLDYRFRIYTNKEAGLIELEEMAIDNDGDYCEVKDCIISHSACAVKEIFVLRFRRFLECYCDSFESDLTREQAIIVFDSMIELTKKSLGQ